MFGNLKGKAVVLMQGRAHLYEGYDVHKVGLLANNKKNCPCNMQRFLHAVKMIIFRNKKY